MCNLTSAYSQKDLDLNASYNSTEFKLPPPLSDNSSDQECSIIEAHKKLAQDGRPNYLGLQIPVKSSLNDEKFAAYLQDYWDWQLPFFIKFGFPLDIKKMQKSSVKK